MGCDPEGVLFWGIAYTDEDELPDGIDEKSWTYREERGKAEVPEPPESPKGKYSGPEWDAWRANREAWENGQCGLHTRGSLDYGRSYACVEGSRRRAEWDETIEVTPELLHVPPEWGPKLKAYCEALGLPWREPKWLLTSYYG